MGFTFIVATQDGKGVNLKPGALGQVNSHIASLKHERDRVVVRELYLPKRRRQKPKSIILELRHPERSHESPLSYGSPQAPQVLDPGLPLVTTEVRLPCTSDLTIQRRDAEIREKITDITTTTRVSSGCASNLTEVSNFDSQILSNLDPFVRLPIPLGPREKDLIQFFLTYGHRLIFRKPVQSSIDPPLQIASRLLQNSPIYILAHPVIAEKMLCKLNRIEVSTNFYLKRAQAYKAMNDLLNDPKATFHDKMTGLTQLSILERTLSSHDLLKKHVQTMDTYLEDNGGLGRFLQETRNKDTTLDPWNYVFHWKYCEITIDTRDRLDKIVARFRQQLEHIGRWHQSLSFRMPSHEFAAGPTDGTSILNGLHKYITHHVTKNLSSPDAPFSEVTATFLFITSLSLTQVKNNYSAADSLSFLTRVNHDFEQDVKLDHKNTTEVSTLDLSAALFFVQDDHDHPGVADTEICQSKIDILRLLPLISLSSRVRLAKRLVQRAMESSLLPSAGRASFDSCYVAELVEEVHRNWFVQQLESLPDLEQIETL